MQILMLAAGESSRFWPFSEKNHKAFLKIGGKPIISSVMDKLNEYEIILVVNPKRELGEEIRGMQNVKLIDQEEALGIEDAIIRAKDLITGDFTVIMPYYLNIDEYIKQIEAVKAPAIALKKYEDGDESTRGIARVENGKIREIREKEKFDGATHSITGVYKFDKTIINKIETNKGKKGFEEILNDLAKEKGIDYFEIGPLPSLKYVTDLLNMRGAFYQDIKKTMLDAEKPKKPGVEDSVIFGKNVRIGNNVSVKGYTFIGDNAFIGDNTLVRDSIIGENAEIGFGTEIARSILMDNAHIHSGFVGDSIIGENCTIGANFITGNKRIDRKSIRIHVKEEEYDTGMVRLGVVIGNDVKTGINVSTMPGTLVGNSSIIGSNTEIKGKIKSNKLVYSKMELIEKDI